MNTDVIYGEEGSNVNAVKIEVDKQRLFLGALLGVSMICNVALLWQFNDVKREVRMQQYYTMELDGKLMAAGLLQYNESWAGSKYNEQQKDKHK